MTVYSESDICNLEHRLCLTPDLIISCVTEPQGLTSLRNNGNLITKLPGAKSLTNEAVRN